MSASLKTAESISDAVRRVCRRHAGSSLKCLRKATRPEAVHEARKEIKKLRAVFRLARGELAKADYRKISKAMRLAAKPMAALRDAQVKRLALETLAGKNAKQKFPDLSAALEKNSRRKRRDFERHDLAAVAKLILKKVCRQLGDLNLKRSGTATPEQCLKKSYCRGQDAWRAASHDPTPENLHKWRRQTKHFWHQLQFLCPEWPVKTSAMVDELEKLGDELGDDHDLVLLKQFAGEHGRRAGETSELNRLIDSRRKQLAEKFQRRGAQLFGKTAEETCAQLKRDWKTWRGG